MAEMTPMRRQYLEIKAKYPDVLLFYRLGDFYELFDDDARIASRELDLVLTTRDRNKDIAAEDKVPMCGVPYHAYEGYLARLVAKGYKVGICEQMEDPSQAKGIVKRDVIRIITPGTVIAASMLDEGRNNYLAAICVEMGISAVCFCDMSTGDVFATSFRGTEAVGHVINELGRFAPKEALLNELAMETKQVTDALSEHLGCEIAKTPEKDFALEECRLLCEKQFGAQAEVADAEQVVLQATGALLNYLYKTQKTDLSHINRLKLYAGGEFMELDLTARRNLELTETMRGKEKKGSLLWVLDQTKTAMGSRMLRSWIERPLLSAVAINKRLDAVKALTNNGVTRQELLLVLRGVSDIERLISRVVYGSAGGRDLVALSAGLSKVPELKELLNGMNVPLLDEILEEMDDLADLRHKIDEAFIDEPPFSVREGGFIRDGYNERVDYLRSVMTGGKDMVAQIETRTKEECGIKNLKVGYNKVFGYYIEVAKSQSNLVPPEWVRKQTTVNSERYISQDLKELEHTILSAKDSVVELEYQLFSQLRDITAAAVGRIQRCAAAIAKLDVLCSLAEVAIERNYCMPEVDESDRLEICDGRHPVVEKVLKNSLFVPNDTKMDTGENTLAIITGPNMAGKSTYMRQVALICLMAQIGSFVPARSAHVGIVDRVFTRIGASDDLAAGQSTFMVEMTEVAEILKNATKHSLLILDEIGRGTSTYDGMSIARAVLEYCADSKRLGAKTLFATHYHELTVLEDELKGVKNYNIAAKKRDDDIIFLRKIIRGGADQSYGIEVAKIAGVPQKVISRAHAILEELEQEGMVARNTRQSDEMEQISFGDMAALEVAEELRRTDVNVLTPIEAMNLIFELKKKLQ